MPPRVGVVTIGDACEKRLVTERVELATSESCVICDCTSAIRTSEIILSQSINSNPEQIKMFRIQKSRSPRHPHFDTHDLW